MSINIVKYIEKLERCKVTNMTAEYVVDEDNHAWLSLVASITLLYKESKAMLSSKKESEIKKRNGLMAAVRMAEKQRPCAFSQFDDINYEVEQQVESASNNVEDNTLRGGHKSKYLVGDGAERRQFKVTKR